ncbi:hypothetical protein ACQV9O_26210, partial [Ralstonia pseudosolanacearum]|uniref:hypothetical protein n=1 Tax=Ralstonia pseudosolanacearum TaxID=1310165 RepID=UPI003D2DB38A
MMASTNLKTLTGANQKKHAVADNAAVRALFLESSGVLWSSEYLVARGADAHVYKQDRDGKLASTVLVPYPKRAPKTATRSAPSIHGLLVENGTLWVSEYQYGMIYRYATNTAGANGTAAIFYEAPPQSGQPAESSTAQYGAMAFQPPEPSGKPVLWVLDTRGKLAGFDASQVSVTAPLYSIPVGVRAQSVDSLVYHAKTKTLWMVVEKTDNQFFLAMLPIQTPTADKLKYYALQDAQALALDGDLLYVGGTQGQIWQVPIETALAASSLGAAATPIITLKGDDGSAAVIFGLAVDKAGGVWATEISAKRHVYGVTPPNGAQQAFVQVTYQLLQTPQSKLASLAWRPPSGAGTKDEALLIADRARNGQVICISPLPGLLPIGPDGKPAYTLEFAPKEGYAFQNEDFGAAEKPPGIKLHAHPSGKPAEYLGGFVSLSVSGTPHVRLTGTSDQ